MPSPFQQPGDKVLYTLPMSNADANEVITRLWTAAKTILATNPKSAAATVRLEAEIGGQKCEIAMVLNR